jgi:hypothetical protein
MFLKQYGERRTGTNYLRALLLTNYPSVTVLMHVLGDKHSPPVRLNDIWREALQTEDPANEFVRRSTWAAPALSTRQRDRDQLRYMSRIADPLCGAYLRGEIGFLISVRDPYAWIESLARSQGWRRRGDSIPGTCAQLVEHECRVFNQRYKAWLDLHARLQSQSSVVRFEDLLRESKTILSRIAAHWRLEMSPDRVMEPPGPVWPAWWDHTPVQYGSEPFHRERRLNENPACLPVELKDVVARTIDWELFQPFGYT